MTATIVGLDQLNLTGYSIPFDRLIEKGYANVNIYDEDDNLVAKIRSQDGSITVEGVVYASSRAICQITCNAQII